MNNGEIKIAFGEDGKAHMLNDDYAIYCADEETFLKVKQAVERSQKMRVNTAVTSKVKAVDLENNEIHTYKVVRCPKCDKPMTLYVWRKFCESCGQALDWSEFREA